MTARKPATTTPVKKPFDPTTCSLGGRNSAKFYRHSELSPRRSRELDLYEVHLMPKLRELALAQKIIGENGEVLAGVDENGAIPVGLSMEESRAMFEMTDTAAWVYLKSWTLRGPDNLTLPLPPTVDDLLDLPRNIYEALIDHAAKITTDQITKPAPFSLDNMEDPDSPTGA